MINLIKPIVFFDIEATGLNTVKDRIIEISLLKVHPDNSEEKKTFTVNPGIPIPAESTAIHGFTDDHIKDKPFFKEIAREIFSFIGDADLGGFNLLKFDIPMLMEELIRADIEFDLLAREVIDVQIIYHRMEQRTLQAAYKFYCGQELINAHSSEADTRATFEVFRAQTEKYQELNTSVPEISKFTGYNNRVDLEGRIVMNEKGEEVFNFGKHKGRKVEEVFTAEPSYYNWMMEGDFSGYTKKVLQKIKLRMLQNKFSGH